MGSALDPGRVSGSLSNRVRREEADMEAVQRVRS